MKAARVVLGIVQRACVLGATVWLDLRSVPRWPPVNGRLARVTRCHCHRIPPRGTEHRALPIFQLCHLQPQLYSALPDQACLLLQDAKHLRLALLGTHTRYAVDHVVQPFPFPPYLFFPRTQHIQAFHA
jgi:hypothetical protein